MRVFENKFIKMNNSVGEERDSILEDIQQSSIYVANVSFHKEFIDCLIFYTFCLKYSITHLKYTYE